MSLIRESIERIRVEEQTKLYEALEIDDDVKKELLHVSAGISGATLGALWASLGVSSTAATVKGLLLAAGFLNPATVTVVASVAAGVVAAGTIAAGGRLAYQYAKNATAGKSDVEDIQRMLSELTGIAKQRDKALYEYKGSSPETVALTKKMKQTSRELEVLATKCLKQGEIDAHAYKICMSVVNKGKLGRLSTLV